MNGAECLLRTLIANGVDLCLMNPGTSEMQFVSALDRVAGMRAVLCLFEGVCSGAADGYARMTGKPAATLLHLGPGLANALANFHNARKARTPVIGIVGEHATQHLQYDAPLTSRTDAFARTVSGYVRVLDRAESMGEAASELVQAALTPPGQVATLIVPADYSWSESGQPGPTVERILRRVPDEDTVRKAGCLLRSGARAGLLLNGTALLHAGLSAAGRISAACGTRVFADRFSARVERGAGVFAAGPVPYFPEPAEAALAGLEHLILVEAQPPVSFFAYPGRRSCIAPPDCTFHVLATPQEDGAAALEALAGELGAPGAAPQQHARPEIPRDGSLTADAIGRVMGAFLPEGAIISDEAISSAGDIWPHLVGAAPHTALAVSGGAIGQGLPVALGAALACPDRKVIAVEADGSGMYTLQALWTMARESADVVTIIIANRRYRILEIEIRRTGAKTIGPVADKMMDLSRPDLDWVLLAKGMGVPAVRAATVDEFSTAFAAAMRESGPRLIEALI